MLKELRQSVGLTQCAVATALGVRQSAVAMWEAGINCPHTYRLPALAALYKTTVEEIVSACKKDNGGDKNDTVSINS